MILSTIIWAIVELVVLLAFIPIAVVETIAWVLIFLVVVLVLTIFDIVMWPFYKIYEKTRKQKHPLKAHTKYIYPWKKGSENGETRYT